MSPKPQHYAKALFELTRELTLERTKHVVEDMARMLRAQGRGGMLPRILAEYRKLLVQRNALPEATIRSGAPLSPEMKKKVLAAVGAEKDVAVHEEIDPSLVGGAVARYNDALLDVSAANRLRKLRETLVQ